MTIPRVLLALALLVIGGMIWGLHKDIYSLKNVTTSQGATVAQRIDALNDNLNQTGDRVVNAAAKPPQVITKTEVVPGKPVVKYRYLKAGRPKARKRRRAYMRITQPEFRWDQLLVITPETAPTYSTPLPP
jgi:hypothetical protein